MKSIELTEKHKEMLLEMCNNLFPENNWFSILNGNVYHSKNGKFLGFSIHWFECSWMLLNKILEKIEKNPISIVGKIQQYGIVCFNKMHTTHPIEWIYNEFKKIKS